MKAVSLCVVGVVSACLVFGQPTLAGPVSDQKGADAARPGRIEIAPLPNVARPASALTIPWTAVSDSSWQSKELFALTDKAGKERAKGWAAVSDTAVLLKVVIHDEHHVNHRTGGTIWYGDSITVCVDATGDAAGSKSPRAATSYSGRPGAAICFALTDTGPEAFALVYGQPNRALAMPQLIAADTIVRDKATKTTTYNIAIPWRELGSSAGAAPAIGLAVTVRDQEDHRLDTFDWGHGTIEVSRAATFNRLFLGSPPAPVSSTAVWKDQIIDEGGYGEVRLVTTDRGALTIEASLDGQTQTFHVSPAGAEEQTPRRFAVRGYPSLPLRTPTVLAVRLTTGDKTLTSGEATLYRSADVIGMVGRRLEAIRGESSTNKLFARHLRSLKAVIDAEWGDNTHNIGPPAGEANRTITYCKFLLDGLNGPAAKWQTYLERRLPLCLSFTSRIDGTLQFYKLLLPPHWDAAKTYPMIVALHGVGNPNPIHFAFRAMIDEPPASKGAYVPEAYVVMPWGRGNEGYRGVAETDVFEAMADATNQFQIDPDRTYLWGHSMGGGGTWSIALRCPDRFAAVGISAGGDWNLPGTDLGGNVTGLPFRIWHGLADTEVPPAFAEKMARELKKYGQDVTVVLTPKAGHNDGWTLAPVMEKWLMRHTRERPDHFEYTADTPEHGGRNGIVMAWEPTLSVAPHFICDLKQGEVDLTVTGTSAVTVNLGPDQQALDGAGIIRGLGLAGKVAVIVNGQEVFRGQVPREPKRFAVPSSSAPAKQ